jgi:import inner membrane translocase subunit TIM23
MTKSATFPAQAPQSLLGVGVTTCAMVPEPCISAVCPSTRASFFVFLSSILLFSYSSHGRFFSTGLGIGGLWGLREGARRPLAVSNSRLRINSILNAVTRRGTFIGNSAGVLGPLCSVFSPTCLDMTLPSLALVYNAINSSIDHWRGRHDLLGSMAAGGLTGAIYKSTGTFSLLPTSSLQPMLFSAGVKPAFAAATFMSGLAGAWSFLKQSV